MFALCFMEEDRKIRLGTGEQKDHYSGPPSHPHFYTEKSHGMEGKHGVLHQGLVPVTALPLVGYLSLETSQAYFSSVKWE